MPITYTNELVILKCNKCGNEMCFYPHTVMYLSECKCGNSNFGHCVRDWPKNQFGDFKILYRGMEMLSILMPYDEEEKQP